MTFVKSKQESALQKEKVVKWTKQDTTKKYPTESQLKTRASKTKE